MREITEELSRGGISADRFDGDLEQFNHPLSLRSKGGFPPAKRKFLVASRPIPII